MEIKKLNKETKILVIIVIFLGLGLIYTAVQVDSLQNRVNQLDWTIVNAGVTIETEDNQNRYTVHLTRGATAIDALQRIATVETINYPGMGMYVTEINSLHENESAGEYWIVYRLDRENRKWEILQTGIDSYELKDEDNIKFSYEKASW